jgi:predicted MFS family arabinose efflux permease
VLIVAATVALMLALNWGGTRFSWGSTPIVSLLAASALVAVLFALRLTTAPEPFLPLSILLNPVVSRGTAAAFFGMGTFIGLSVYVPVYLQTVTKLSASLSGVALIPLVAGVMVGATFAGRLMMHVRHYKRPPMVGLVVAIIGIALLAVLPEGLPLWAVEVVLGAVGVGIGTLLPVTTVAVQNAVGLHDMGTATGAMNFFRSLGGAIVVAAFGAIVLGGAGVHGGAIEDLGTVASQQGVDLAGVFRWTFAAAVLGLIAGLGFLLAMEERPLRSGSPRASAAAAAAE